MPHDAALYATSVKQRRSPAETAAANEAAVAAARVEFEESEDQAESTYRGVTGQGGPVTLDSITPTGGPTGTVITCKGAGFVPTSKVKAGATELTTTYVDATTLTAPVTGAAGAKNITVDNGKGDVSNIKVFTIAAAE